MKFKLGSMATLMVVALAAGGAQATTTALGPVSVSLPTIFQGYAPVGPFSDVFTFNLPTNGGSGYSVANFSLAPLSSSFNTVLATMSLISNPDGILFNTDDTLLSSTVAPGGNTLTLAQGPTTVGDYYLVISGLTNGSQGGIYSGAISVSAVPEPETYAMMLAGLVAVGFLARRRG